MTLSPESVQEFIALYRAEFGIELAYDAAEAMGSDLLSFYQLIMPKT